MLQRILSRVLVTILVCAPAVIARAEDQATWKVGDKVDAWNVAWYPAVVKEIGSGKNEGSFLVKFDKFSTDQWVAAKNVRTRKDGPAPAEATKSWKVGEKVEGWNVAWYAGTVKEIGSGKYQGYYLVKWDKYDTDQWVEAKSVRARRDPAAEAKKAAKLSLAMGKYQCAVFLDGKFSPISTFTLQADGTYASSVGEGGKYEHDVKGKRVKFVGGTLEDSVGRVEAETEHNRLIIRLNKKPDLAESEYTQNWRAQYCSPVK